MMASWKTTQTCFMMTLKENSHWCRFLLLLPTSWLWYVYGQCCQIDWCVLYVVLVTLIVASVCFMALVIYCSHCVSLCDSCHINCSQSVLYVALVIFIAATVCLHVALVILIVASVCFMCGSCHINCSQCVLYVALVTLIIATVWFMWLLSH